MVITVSTVCTNQRQKRIFNRSNRLHELEVRVVRLEQYMEVQHTITQIIAAASELKTALPSILKAICETADWDFGEVWYVKRQDNRLHCESTWLHPSLQLPQFENSGRAITFKPGKGLPGRVWASGKPVWVPNVVVDKNFMRAMLAEQDGLHAGIAIPIRTEGEIIGALTFFSRNPRPVDRELLQVLYTAGNQTGLFIERKRAEQAEREREWLLAASEERQRLARDLHDSVTQTLFSASVVAEMLPLLWKHDPAQVELGLRQVKQLTREALDEIRSLVSEMRSSSATCNNLTILLKKLAEKLMTWTNIVVHLDIRLPVTLPDTVQMTVYRIAQEALNNIAKHAKANQVLVCLYIEDDGINLSIKDNGQGFDTAVIPAGHFGIDIMRERAASIGSTLQINSTPGNGTHLRLHIPLQIMLQLIRVMIVDDHPVVRQGLTTFLNGFDDLLMVAEAANGKEALRLCSEAQPNVILMDMFLPDTNGIQLTKTIREQNPDVQVVMLTSSQEEAQVQTALQAGAIGYMHKNVSVQDMVNIIRLAYAGKPALTSEVTQALINLTIKPHNSPIQYNLTEREQHILGLMVDGLTNQEIADKIFVSRSTVKNYVSTILSKLGVQNRIEAVRLAVEQSLFD
jgi:DNA-binding NarL/FixJ family response regulator/signal transduction histidine kinase